MFCSRYKENTTYFFIEFYLQFISHVNFRIFNVFCAIFQGNDSFSLFAFSSHRKKVLYLYTRRNVYYYILKPIKLIVKFLQTFFEQLNTSRVKSNAIKLPDMLRLHSDLWATTHMYVCTCLIHSRMHWHFTVHVCACPCLQFYPIKQSEIKITIEIVVRQKKPEFDPKC